VVSVNERTSERGNRGVRVLRNGVRGCKKQEEGIEKGKGGSDPRRNYKKWPSTKRGGQRGREVEVPKRLGGCSTPKMVQVETGGAAIVAGKYEAKTLCTRV